MTMFRCSVQSYFVHIILMQFVDQEGNGEQWRDDETPLQAALEESPWALLLPDGSRICIWSWSGLVGYRYMRARLGDSGRDCSLVFTTIRNMPLVRCLMQRAITIHRGHKIGGNGARDDSGEQNREDGLGRVPFGQECLAAGK